MVSLTTRTAASGRYRALYEFGTPMAARRKKPRWSQRVTRTSNALDLEQGVFTWSNPGRIARSLKRSAETSTRRKADPFRSAMSMLNFYINRVGRVLPSSRKRVLTQAKGELRKLFRRRSQR